MRVTGIGTSAIVFNLATPFTFPSCCITGYNTQNSITVSNDAIILFSGSTTTDLIFSSDTIIVATNVRYALDYGIKFTGNNIYFRGNTDIQSNSVSEAISFKVVNNIIFESTHLPYMVANINGRGTKGGLFLDAKQLQVSQNASVSLNGNIYRDSSISNFGGDACFVDSAISIDNTSSLNIYGLVEEANVISRGVNMVTSVTMYSGSTFSINGDCNNSTQSCIGVESTNSGFYGNVYSTITGTSMNSANSIGVRFIDSVISYFTVNGNITTENFDKLAGISFIGSAPSIVTNCVLNGAISGTKNSVNTISTQDAIQLQDDSSVEIYLSTLEGNINTDNNLVPATGIGFYGSSLTIENSSLTGIVFGGLDSTGVFINTFTTTLHEQVEINGNVPSSFDTGIGIKFDSDIVSTDELTLNGSADGVQSKGVEISNSLSCKIIDIFGTSTSTSAVGIHFTSSSEITISFFGTFEGYSPVSNIGIGVLVDESSTFNFFSTASGNVNFFATILDGFPIVWNSSNPIELLGFNVYFNSEVFAENIVVTNLGDIKFEKNVNIQNNAEFYQDGFTNITSGINANSISLFSTSSSLCGIFQSQAEIKSNSTNALAYCDTGNTLEFHSTSSYIEIAKLITMGTLLDIVLSSPATITINEVSRIYSHSQYLLINS